MRYIVQYDEHKDVSKKWFCGLTSVSKAYPERESHKTPRTDLHTVRFTVHTLVVSAYPGGARLGAALEETCGPTAYSPSSSETPNNIIMAGITIFCLRQVCPSPGTWNHDVVTMVKLRR